jgi:hypothetical protein
MKNNNVLVLFTLLLLTVAVVPTVFAGECLTPEDHGMFCSASEAFEANPDLANFMEINNPTVEQFSRLTGEGDQRNYLMRKYDEGLARHYITTINFNAMPTSMDAIERSVDNLLIAEKFFSEGDNVNDKKYTFGRFMNAQGVDIELNGNIESYESDGTITVNKDGDRTSVNVKEFKDKYSFSVDPDGTLFLQRKGAARGYTIEGTVTKNSRGNIEIKDEGTVNDVPVKNVYNLHIGTDGKIRATAEQFGELEFEGRAHVVYEETGDMNADGRGYYTLHEAQLKDKQFELTGRIFVEGGKVKVAAGDELSITPYGDVEGDQGAADHWFNIVGRGNVEHEALQNEDYIIVAQNDDVTVDMDKPWKQAIKAYLFERSEEPENKVSFTEDKMPLLESKPKEEHEEADYRFEVDTGTLITVKEEQSDEEKAPFMALPARGYFKVGDKPTEGSPEAKTLEALQEHLGIIPTGEYDALTKSAVTEWQEDYNARNNLFKGSSGRLSPDGLWGGSTRGAFIHEPKDVLTSTREIIIEPKGARVALDVDEDGVHVMFDEGLADIELAGARTRVNEGHIERNMLVDEAMEEIQTPVTISTHKEGAEYIIDDADSDVDADNTFVKDDTIDSLTSIDGEIEYTSFGEQVLEGVVDNSCAFDNLVDKTEAGCSAYVQRRYSSGFGSPYVTIPFDKDGENVWLTPRREAGLEGNAWQIGKNIEEHGGASLARVPNNELRSRHRYDYGSMQEDDVIGVYYPPSDYIDEAKRDGEGREYTHVVYVEGQRRETHTPSGGTVRDLFEETIGVTTDTVMGSYPIYVQDLNDNYIPKEARLGSDGSFYFTDQLDASGMPLDGEYPIKLDGRTKVTVEKTMVSHLYHGEILTEDFGRMLEDKGMYFSEHLRPNEGITERAADRQQRQGLTPVQIDSGSIAGHLRSEGVDERMIPYLEKIARQRNGLVGKEIHPGEVVFLPDAKNYVDGASHDNIQMSRVLFQSGIEDAEEIVDTVYTSARERQAEYGLTNKETEELAQIAAYVGMQESTWGGLVAGSAGGMGYPGALLTLGEYSRDKYKGKDGLPIDYGKKFEAEQVFLETSDTFGLRWTPSDDFSGGYLQTQVQLAESETEALVDAGGIEESDFEGAHQLTTYEGSTKFGMRPMARYLDEYTDPSMSLEEKAIIVSTVYHYGEDQPRWASLQDMALELVGEEKAEEITGSEFKVDGYPGRNTLTLLKHWADQNGVQLDINPDNPDDVKKVDMEYLQERGFDSALSSSWSGETGQPERDHGMFFPPPKDGRYTGKIMEYCSDFGGGCAVPVKPLEQ